MCGIAGFINTRRDQDGPALEGAARAMADAIAHRGPDSSGVWCDPAQGIALGHRRLAIVDLSPAGHQPMVSESGRYTISYNGEIYNFKTLREKLPHREFRGTSDTEIMLAAIEAWGIEKALHEMNGMFAFALWDRRENVLHLARDRVGKKPLYYGWCSGVFLFGSELKALRAHPGFTGEIDRDALAAYTRHNYIPAPWSIYQGIYKLPAATLLSLKPGQREGVASTYWDIEALAKDGQQSPRAFSLDDAARELDEVLGQAVRERLVADVPLGAFLSGGIDSSLVTALMQKHSGQPVKTFTIGFGEEGFNEAEHARAIARHLGTDHTEFTVTAAEAQAVIPRLPLMFDEPFADSSQIPTWHVAHLARRHVTVALSGDGGDESFAGYGRYHMANLAADGLFAIPGGMRRPLGMALHRLPVRGKLRKFFAAMDVADPDELYTRMMTHWQEGDGVMRRAVPAEKPHIPGMDDYISRMMLRDTLTYLPDDVLVKVDRAPMDVALEARAPLLDHRVMEFAWRLPPDLKRRGGTGKIVLRHLLKNYVPEALFDRPKRGFSVPVAAWLRGPLRDWAEDLLDESRLRDEGFFDPLPIRRRWAEHCAGRDDWSQPLWGILMFQAWNQTNGKTVNKAQI